MDGSAADRSSELDAARQILWPKLSPEEGSARMEEVLREAERRGLSADPAADLFEKVKDLKAPADSDDLSGASIRHDPGKYKWEVGSEALEAQGAVVTLSFEVGDKPRSVVFALAAADAVHMARRLDAQAERLGC